MRYDLERLKARDPQAQAALHRALNPRVLALCRHYLGSGAVAEHTAADLWTDLLYRDIDHVRSVESLGGYVRMMAVRRCLRVRRVRARESAPEPPETGAGSEADLVEVLDTRRRIERLERCMEELRPRVRRVLRMRFHHQMTQVAIGESLSVSKQYAGRIVARGIDALRRCMEKADETGHDRTAA